MIVLLALTRADADRWCRLPGRPDVEVVVVLQAADVRADLIEPGARVMRTDHCSPSPAVISALQALHARIGLVDPTGLLGPLDPEARKPATAGPTRQYNDPPGGVRKGRGGW